ncbi:hypothetical protein QLQ12_36475 [Actinoplanes sp. NEAU-A12]|uniref:Uncharacterized protein n=1 Tax=Actinoplanes sandaracinus TaxID=3045177 RepID=A0ABT6WWH4_9ACTN|nr:hypothetical protein [Actinoplanes sandaracinus]MDI6104102.1 hypothetical protein [Actinoplanes sandaracinus]
MPTAENLPPAQSCRVIDFERADVVSLMIYPPPPPMLVVAGQKPFANMQVSLNPLRYAQKPEYWGIEVVGCMPPSGQPAIVPYVVELSLAGYIGTCGIEVIGASHTKRIELAAAFEGTPPETAVDETAA